MKQIKREKPFGFTTRQLHAGQKPDPTTGASVTPIYQTASYVFNDSDHAARLFSLEEQGNIYSRIQNPTNAVFEARMADLEGGVGALATSSGHAAQALLIMTLCEAGDHIVAASTLYGGTISQLANTFPKFGIQTTFINPNDIQAFSDAIRPETKLIWGESLGNPGINVFPFQEVASIAKQNHIPLVIDNTFASPYLCRPFEWGADLVVHSTTKFIGGHGNAIGGIIVDSGNFDWQSSDRFPNFTNPDPANHNMVYTKFKEQAFLTKARVQSMRDIGACQSPFNAWLFLLGLETLSLRMDRHVQNAQVVAEFLHKHNLVNWVKYPGLPDHYDYELAKKYFPKGAGAVMGFGIKGGLQAGKKFIDNMKLISHLANLGDSRSLAIHPASTTHSQLNTKQLEEAGVSPDFIRLSVGLEDIEDLLWDLDQALIIAAQ